MKSENETWKVKKKGETEEKKKRKWEKARKFCKLRENKENQVKKFNTAGKKKKQRHCNLRVDALLVLRKK